jgi:hypothetical protein
MVVSAVLNVVWNGLLACIWNNRGDRINAKTQ